MGGRRAVEEPHDFGKVMGERVEDIFQISGDILADSNVCLKIAAELIETIAPAEKSAGASRITKR